MLKSKTKKASQNDTSLTNSQRLSVISGYSKSVKIKYPQGDLISGLETFGNEAGYAVVRFKIGNDENKINPIFTKYTLTVKYLDGENFIENQKIVEISHNYLNGEYMYYDGLNISMDNIYYVSVNAYHTVFGLNTTLTMTI